MAADRLDGLLHVILDSEFRDAHDLTDGGLVKVALVGELIDHLLLTGKTRHGMLQD